MDIPENAGKPGNAGTPESVGKPGNAGTLESAGKPGDAGTPESVGNPESAGKPGNAGTPESAGIPGKTGIPDVPEEGSRVGYATALFECGYNCAQSVFAAYADLFGMDRQTALKMSSAMGGGIGRMREVCGTVAAMAMLAGLKEGNDEPENEEAKEHIYALVRRMSAQFKEQHGTIICRELLGIEGMEESARPTRRTPEFYAARPCGKIIACAAKIIEGELLGNR